MKSFKQTAAALALVCASSSASAQGIPVIDVANLAQALQQVLAWGQQQAQMASQLQNQIQQIQQLQATLSSMTGQRALGLVANNVGVTDVIPANVLTQLQALQTSIDLLNKVKDVANNAMATSQNRGQQIQALMAAINKTTDAKSIAEIQARIAAENAAVTNDANRIAVLDLQQRVDAERINNAIKAANDQNAVSPKRTAADFKNIVTLGK